MLPNATESVANSCSLLSVTSPGWCPAAIAEIASVARDNERAIAPTNSKVSPITLRVLGALRDADVVACEDTRRTRVLLDRHGVSARTVSYHEHNEASKANTLVARMQEGETVALVSDAGMPLVSDPGYVLVRACVAAGLEVEVLPGPSAVLAALVASALPAETWRFVGFLPRKAGELTTLLGGPETIVAFESPTTGPRGEVVLVIGGADQAAGDLAEEVEAMRTLVEAGARARPAAQVVGRLTGISANALYKALTDRD